MRGTRIYISDALNQGKYNALVLQAELLGVVRSEVWQRFGSINGVGISHRKIRTDWVAHRNFTPLPAKAWKETLRDGIDDIALYTAACKEKVRKKIHIRFKQEKERKKYFGLLKYNGWVNDGLLCRWMRKAKKHGKNHSHHQIILENGVYSQFIGKEGRTWLKIPSLIRGKRIAIPLNTNVHLHGMLRLIIKNNQIEIHCLANKKQPKPCGKKTVGVDKGYSEVLADSEGNFHGEEFNQLLTPISNARNEKNKKRNKLTQIAKKSKPSKQTRIIKNNLGTKKRHRHNRKIKQQIRSHCFKAVHSVVDKAKHLVVEDLTTPIPKKNNWKQFNRLMNQWTKGSITEALETITKARGSCLHYVNAAYTSQMDSNTHLLEGNRVGDKFYHANGEVGQADTNAACNILQRLSDPEIGRYTPYLKVKQILQNRLHASKELVPKSGMTAPSGL